MPDQPCSTHLQGANEMVFIKAGGIKLGSSLPFCALSHYNLNMLFHGVSQLTLITAKVNGATWRVTTTHSVLADPNFLV